MSTRRGLAATALSIVVASLVLVRPSGAIAANDGAVCGSHATGWSLDCAGERAIGQLGLGAGRSAGLGVESTSSGLVGADSVERYLLDLTGLSKGYSQSVTATTDGISARCSLECVATADGAENALLPPVGNVQFHLGGGTTSGRISVDVRPTASSTVVDLLILSTSAATAASGCGNSTGLDEFRVLAREVATSVEPSARRLHAAVAAARPKEAIDALADLMPILVATTLTFSEREQGLLLAACLRQELDDTVGFDAMTAHATIAMAPVVDATIQHFDSLTSRALAPTTITARFDPTDVPTPSPAVSGDVDPTLARIDPASWEPGATHWDSYGPTLNDDNGITVVAGGAVGWFAYHVILPTVPDGYLVVSARMAPDLLPENDGPIGSHVLLRVNAEPVDSFFLTDPGGTDEAWTVPPGLFKVGQNDVVFEVLPSAARGLRIFGPVPLFRETDPMITITAIGP